MWNVILYLWILHSVSWAPLTLFTVLVSSLNKGLILTFSFCSLCVYSVAQSCLTVFSPIDCSLSGFSVHGILQAKILEWLPFCFSLIFSKSHFFRALLIYQFYNNFPSLTSNYSTSLFLNLQSRSLLLLLIITDSYYHHNRMGTNLLLIPGKYLQLQ